MNQQKAIQVGDIHRTEWNSPETQSLNLYQGSGRSGACWNSWGLMNSEAEEKAWFPRQKKTVWMHADHWHRGEKGTDSWLSVGRLIWADRPPSQPQFYAQHLSLADGRLTTKTAGPEGSYTFCSYFDPGHPDVLAFEIEYDFPSATLPSLLFQPSREWNVGGASTPAGNVQSLEERAEGRLLKVDTGTVTTHLGLRVATQEGSCRLVSAATGVKIEFCGSRGRHFFLLGAANESRGTELNETLRAAEPARWAAEARANWKTRWGQGWIHIPEPFYQAIWARSHYYLLSSYGADVRSPAPPMGWSGNNWPYHFPQDLSYIHPALLRLGHLDIAKSWIEFYHRTIPSMRETTRRLFKADGIMWAWSYPIGEQSQMAPEKASDIYAFQIHNVGYVARMAFETAQYLRDPGWTRQIAWDVVCESARFFASLAKRGSDGRWNLYVIPSSGQDEFDESQGKNYLCSLFSSQYALQAGVRLAASLGIANKEIVHWQNILADGLAFPRLLDAQKGIYATAEGVDLLTRFGVQKHPVQVNPLCFLPLGRLTAPTLEAYRHRHQICIGHETQEYVGWTLPAYWVSAAHMNDAKGLLDDLNFAVPTGTIDPDGITIYESAKAQWPYFITSHGLYCQALQDALVNDYGGANEFGQACHNAWSEVAFGGLRTSDGGIWGGRRSESGWQIENGRP